MDEAEALALAAAAKARRKPKPNRALSAVQQAAHGLTFGGIDEMAGAVGGLMRAPGEGTFAEGYAETRDKARGELDAGRQAYPVQSAVSEVAGGIANPAARVGSLGQGASALRRLIAGSLGGAGYGALYGYGTGEGGVGERMDNAQSVGGWGAVAGAAAPVLAGGVQKIANSNAAKGAIRRAARNAPTTDALRSQASAAYRAVDNAGVQIKPQAFDRLRQGMTSAMSDAGLDQLPGAGSLTPNAARVNQIAGEMSGQMGQNPSAALPFSSLDQLRRHAGTAAGNMANRTDSAAGTAAIGQIDDFVANLSPADVTSGDVRALREAIGKARDTYSRMARSRTVDEAIEASDNYLSGGASGIRNQFRRILSSPKMSRGFSDAEKQMMRRVVNGSMPEQILHLLGGGLGQLGSIGAGLGIGGLPGALGGAAVAAGARKGSEAIARRNAETVRAVIANGGLPQLPQANPLYRLLTERLMRQGTAAAASQ